MLTIRYVKIDHPRYKYELTENYAHPRPIAIRPASDIVIPYTAKPGALRLGVNGVLTIDKHYAWDGPSGPTPWDSPNFMRGSLVHDALYQMLREGRIGNSKTDRATWEKNRKHADELLYETCREDEMTWLVAKAVYYAVRVGGAPAAYTRVL